VTIRDNRLLADSGGLGKIWHGQVDINGEMNGVYRPSLLTSFSALGRVAGFDPPPFRLVSLVLHALNAFLFFLLAQQLFRLSSLAAITTALIFLLHPLQTTDLAIAWKQSDLWVSLFTLSSLLLLNRAKGIVPALLLFLLALGFKETALVIPFLWLVTEPLRAPEGRSSRIIAGVTGIMTGATFFLSLPVLMRPSSNPSGFPGSGWSYLLTQLGVYPYYLTDILWPTHLTIDRMVPLATSLSASLVLSLAIVSVVFVGLVVGTVRRSAAAVSILLAALCLLPTSSLYPLSLLYDETRLYLVLGFLAIGLVKVTVSILPIERVRPALRVALTLSLALLLLLMGRAGTFRWRSEETLWASALAVDPMSLRAHYQLGYLAQKARVLDEAEWEFRNALALNPEFPNARLHLGIVLGQRGDLDGAAREFRQLLSADPYWASQAHFYLGLNAIYRHDFAKAREEFSTVRKLSPGSGDAERGEAILNRARAYATLRK
jgi:protein O-mannosyl-transferase